MEQFMTAVTQIGIFFILILVGVMTVKLHILDKRSLESISGLVINVSLPCYIFINACESASLESLRKSIIIAPLAVLIYITLILVSMTLERIFSLRENRGRIFRASMVFGNIGFMGIPLVSVIYPQNAVLYVSVFTIVDQLFFWTYGVRLTEPVGEKNSPAASFDPRNLFSPPLAAIVLALIFIVTSIPVPGIFSSSLSAIGSTSMPLALIYIGGILCMTDIRPVLWFGELYAGIVFKMTLLPIVCFVILSRIGVAGDMAGTLAYMIALPGVEIVPMLAAAHGSDGDYSVCAVMMTTLASLVTLPIVSLGVSFLA